MHLSPHMLRSRRLKHVIRMRYPLYLSHGSTSFVGQPLQVHMAIFRREDFCFPMTEKNDKNVSDFQSLTLNASPPPPHKYTLAVRGYIVQVRPG